MVNKNYQIIITAKMKHKEAIKWKKKKIKQNKKINIFFLIILNFPEIKVYIIIR